MVIGDPAVACDSGDWARDCRAPPWKAVIIRIANVVATNLPFLIVLVRRVSYPKIPENKPEKRLREKIFLSILPAQGKGTD
jgi:hypothetical protein